MCGRYAIGTSSNELIDLLELLGSTPFEPNFNVAPTQSAPVVFHSRHAGGAVGRMVQWGLVPPWARDDTQGAKLINARSETANEKPSFRGALESRRVLVPMNGYYEWKREGKDAKPFFISSPAETLMLAAGIWERHQSEASAQALFTFSILTCDATKTLRSLHDRMPVFVPPNLRNSWLNPDEKGAFLLEELNAQTHTNEFQFHRVSDAIGSTRSQGPELMDYHEEAQTSLFESP